MGIKGANLNIKPASTPVLGQLTGFQDQSHKMAKTVENRVFFGILTFLLGKFRKVVEKFC